jgi:hypothetical protein
VEEEKRKDNTSELTETVKKDHKSGIMVLECEEGRDALTHVLTNVFQVQGDHPLSLSLQEHGFHDIQAIVDAPRVDIDALTYKDYQGSNVVDLPKNHKYMILLLKSYHRLTCSALGNHIGYDWKSLTARDFDDFVEQRGFEPISLRQVPSIQSTTPIKPKEATIAHETLSEALIELKPASKESIALELAPKTSIALKTPSKASIVLATLSKASIVPETPSKASIILDMSSCICQEVHCPRTQVVTPQLMVAPGVLVDGESNDNGGKDVLIDVATSLDTFHDAQMFLYHAYPIPLAMLQGHYNTVHLLPPANGPPTLPR